MYRNKRIENFICNREERLCTYCKSIKPPENAKCFEIYFLSFVPLYRIFFLLCSVVALGTRGYFYCGCILYVLLSSDVLFTVLTAVRRSGMFLV